QRRRDGELSVPSCKLDLRPAEVTAHAQPGLRIWLPSHGGAMQRTRLSLFYLATYLPIAGLLLLFVPDFATKLLLSNRTYDDVFTRLAGALLLALGILVIQIVRHRVEVLYPWTVVIRIGLCTVLAALYL